MYDGPGIVQQILWVLVPATVLGLVIGLCVFAGVYFAISLAMKRQKTGMSENSVPQDAIQIVRERYARGDISRAEYEQLREDLGDEAGSAHSSYKHEKGEMGKLPISPEL